MGGEKGGKQEKKNKGKRGSLLEKNATWSYSLETIESSPRGMGGGKRIEMTP